MRNLVRWGVMVRFGPLCGATELRGLREQYVEKALAIYDRDLSAGEPAAQARKRAHAAVSNMDRELVASDTLGKRRRWRLFASMVCLAMLAFLLLVGLFLTHRDWRSVLFLAGVAVLGPALQAFGVNWLLRKKRYKFIPVLCIVLGGLMVLCVVNDLQVMHCDYREKLDRIQSIEVIELTKTAISEEELEYQVLYAIDPAEWEALIADVACLDYTYPVPIGNTMSKAWDGGPIRLLIRFKPGEDRLRLIILGESLAYGEEGDSQIGIFAPPLTCKGWDALAEKYGFPVRP